MSAPVKATVHECPACGGPVFTYPSGNVIPHYDGDGLRCQQNGHPLSQPQQGSLARRRRNEAQLDAAAATNDAAAHGAYDPSVGAPPPRPGSWPVARLGVVGVPLAMARKLAGLTGKAPRGTWS